MKNNIRPDFDKEIQLIADYVLSYQINSELALTTAYYDLLDSMACALLALQNDSCRKILGPIVPGALLQNGCKVPGTGYQLDPVQAAFNFGVMIRWLDFNDTWLAAEWGHPSDNLGGIMMLADYINRMVNSKTKLTINDLYHYQIKAHEIQGILALENSFNQVGVDHVILVKIATTAIATLLLGGDRQQILNALSNAWVDGQSLRTYRHAPNTGSRKSWAAGDATSRGVFLSLLSMRGEAGYPSALSAPKWGFYDTTFKSKPLKINRPFDSYVMENVLFKIAFPAEFHAQTAVECALKLHPLIKDRLYDIKTIRVSTQEAGMRIINKTGPLYNPADRDHCLQYMIAVPLIYGELTAKHYEDDIAKNPLIDQLRDLMQVEENPQFSKNYLEPEKRSIGNSVQIEFKDGSTTEKISIEYPIGHKRRRDEGIPLLKNKFIDAVSNHYSRDQSEKILKVCFDPSHLAKMPVNEFTNLFFKEFT